MSTPKSKFLRFLFQYYCFAPVGVPLDVVVATQSPLARVYYDLYEPRPAGDEDEVLIAGDGESLILGGEGRDYLIGGVAI